MAVSKINGNGRNGQHVTGSARIVATAEPTQNKEKAELTINSPEALQALQNHEIQQRQDNKVNLLKKALDGYADLTTNFGTTDFVRGAAFNFLLDGAKDIDAECGYPPWLIPQQYNYMYDREAIAKRVVDCLPEETWAEDPEIWEDDDPDVNTPFEEVWGQLEEQHNLFSMIQRADVLSGIGQFGIILIGIDDGKDLREPVDGIFDDGTIDPEVEHKLLYLRVFSEVVVFVKVREIDPTSPRCQQPKIYTIQYRDYPNWGVQAGEIIARDVHWTRVIHVADNRKESEVYGVPRMQPVYNRLYDLRKIYSSSGEGYWKGAFPGLAFEVNPEVAAQGVELDVKSIREEMERFQNGLQRYLALTGVTTKSLPATMMDPAGTVETHLRAIAICLGIPTRILWGSEEAVLAGNQDSRAWNKRLSKRQTKYVNPLMIRPFINRLIGMGILPPPKGCLVPADGGNGSFVITGGYKIEWPDLNAPTDMDKAQVASAETQAMAAYVQGGVSQLMAPREYLTHVLGYSVQEADAILEASMEFSGDEEEPLSAASQAAQEQEAAEQSHEQALELQGAKGENTKPERNSAGLEANALSDILHNPSKGELQAHFDSAYQAHGESVVLRGVVNDSDHIWGDAFDTSHDGLYHQGLAKNPKDWENPTRVYAHKSGTILQADTDEPHEVPGIGSKLQPAKKFIANAGVDKDFILHNPDKGKLQALFDTASHRTDPIDPWRKGNERTGEYVLRGLMDDEGNHRWADANHFEHGELGMGKHYGSNQQLAAPMGGVGGALHIKADGKILLYDGKKDQPYALSGIGGQLKAAKKVVANAAFTVLPNPKPNQLHKVLAQHNKELGNDGSRPPTNPVLRGLVDLDSGDHYWAKAHRVDHADLILKVDPREKRNFYSVVMQHNGEVHRGAQEGLNRESDTAVAGHLKKAGLSFEKTDSAGMENNSAWSDGWKAAPAQDKSERAARQVLTNPSREDLQGLMDTVHQHNQEKDISYSPLKIVLRGVSNEGGSTHKWGSSYYHEHHDLKGGDMSLKNHLYVSTTGHIAKMGRMGGFEPVSIPKIGTKLQKVQSVVANEEPEDDPTRITINPSRQGALKLLKEGGNHRIATTATDVAMGRGSHMLHSSLASKAFGGESLARGYAMLQHREAVGPEIVVHDERDLNHPHLKKLGIPMRVGDWDGDGPVANESFHQKMLTNPTKPDLQALFDTVHHRLASAQALGTDDVVLRGVISRGGDKHVWGNAFEHEHEDLKDNSGDSDIAKGSHLYIHPSGKIFKFGKGYQEQEYNVPGIGSKLKPAKSMVANEGDMKQNKARPRDMLHDQDQSLTPPQEDQPKPYAEVENLPGDQDQDDEEQREEGGLGGANPDNGDALATPNLSREGIKHPVDPEMIQLPTINVDGGREFKTFKVIDGDQE